MPETPSAAYRDGERDPAWPEGCYWSEAEGRPVYSPQREDGSEEQSAAVSLSAVSPDSTGLPHLERACELLWQYGHPAVAEALEREVKEALRRG